MRNHKNFVLGMMVVPLALLGLGVVFAGSVSTPHSFVAGTSAVAADVNANFSAHEAAINDNDSRLDALESPATAVPSFHVYVGTLSQGGTGVIIFGTEDHDDGGAYDHTTGVFTAPKAGVYSFTFHTRISLAASGDLSLVKNGSTPLVTTLYTASRISGPMSTTAKLAQGDTVSVLRHATLIVVGTQASPDRHYTTFAGHLIQDL